MNRRQRRAAARTAGGRAALSYADQYECPDCTSDTALRRDDSGVFHLDVRHDDTCPTYRRGVWAGRCYDLPPKGKP